MLTKTTIEDLKQFQLFSQLTVDELRYLVQNLEEKEYKKNEVIYKETELPGIIYLVQRGSVEITKKTPSGHRQVIAAVPAGQFFGELSFFVSRRHASRAKVTADGRILLLHRFIYDEMEKQQPSLVHKLLREIILKMSSNLDSMNDMFLQTINYTFYGGGKAGKIEESGHED
ncbi:MAG: cyclic nucleotide-binding domain-containing protein [Candidatus Manganitrophaceae bacterium]|nr:MAG: cyclic nucleotide-binding domain-containing protein [Candidatus Manganitrophaceae bacterium]